MRDLRRNPNPRPVSLLKNVFRVGAARWTIEAEDCCCADQQIHRGCATDAECTEISAHRWARAIWCKMQRSFRSKQGRASSLTSRSRGATFVAMMQTARFRKGDDLAGRRRLYTGRSWAILVERKMSSGLVMILKIARQDAAQVALVEDDDMVQTFAADRTDEAFDIGVLPGFGHRSSTQWCWSSRQPWSTGIARASSSIGGGDHAVPDDPR